jgi:branched-chain amino acid transport system permease protein
MSFSAKVMWFGALLVIMIVLPFFLPPYWKDVLVLFTVNVILVMSYRLITTMGGWSFAHIAIMGFGAYTMALLTTRYYNLSFWVALPLSGIVSGVFALIISYPVLRTRRFNFFLSTFAGGEALRQCFIQFDFPFGGIEGISFIERPSGIFGINFNNIISIYYLILALTLAIGLFLYRFDKCRIGQTIKGVAANETLSESIGMNAWGYKALAFVMGSFFAGLGGALFGNYNGFIAPTDVTSVFMFKIVAAAIVGGTNTFVGPLFGLVFLTLLQEIFRDFHIWLPFVYGVALVLILLFLPNGIESLMGLRPEILEKRRFNLGRIKKLLKLEVNRS